MSDPTGPHGQRRRYNPVDSTNKYSGEAAQRLHDVSDSVRAGNKAGAKRSMAKADSALAKADRFMKEAQDSTAVQRARKKRTDT